MTQLFSAPSWHRHRASSRIFRDRLLGRDPTDLFELHLNALKLVRDDSSELRRLSLQEDLDAGLFIALPDADPHDARNAHEFLFVSLLDLVGPAWNRQTIRTRRVSQADPQQSADQGQPAPGRRHPGGAPTGRSATSRHGPMAEPPSREPRARNVQRICSATSTRRSERTCSIWLRIVATAEPAYKRPTATSSGVVTKEPESPPADMLVVTI